MRSVLMILAFAGVVVSSLALQVHYSTATEPCSINEKWDCGIVNHSPYAMIGWIPVAAIGIAGYIVLGYFAFNASKRIVLALAIPALAYALYLTHIEKDLLMVYCLYCVGSLVIISLITVLSLGWQFAGRAKTKAE
jgi:uncharacterized membrane protein